MKMENKEFFNAGELVKCKHLENSPIMVVSKVVKLTLEQQNRLLGVECYWFDDNKAIQIYQFNTKDLVKI